MHPQICEHRRPEVEDPPKPYITRANPFFSAEVPGAPNFFAGKNPCVPTPRILCPEAQTGMEPEIPGNTAPRGPKLGPGPNPRGRTKEWPKKAPPRKRSWLSPTNPKPAFPNPKTPNGTPNCLFWGLNSLPPGAPIPLGSSRAGKTIGTGPFPTTRGQTEVPPFPRGARE